MSTPFLYSEFDVKYIDDGSEYTLNLTADIKLDKIQIQTISDI